nr:MAG: glycine oxidase ThiO [Hyphomicrobiales bacterium]
MRTVIIGGGVAGLAIGWRLAASGCEVEVLERALAGRASSWAAAGMLAATAETQMQDNAHTRLAQEGRARWPKFAEELETASKIRLGYRECGSMLIAHTNEGAIRLQSTARKLARRGENVSWCSREEALRREPLLNPSIKGALRAADDAQVDNRQLSVALAQAFIGAGGVLREQCDVRSLLIKSGKVGGVVTADGNIFAEKVVIAAGAWTSKIAGLDDGVLPPVRPAKGQMTAVKPPKGVRMPNHLIWGEDVVYLVPREETLLIGATVEDVGFETSVSLDAMEELIALASRQIPSLSTWSIVESWAGLRPRTPDDSPVVGATPVEGLFVASGQYRNGILFAPVLADMICALLLEGDTGPLFQYFDTKRFVKN